MPPVCSRVMCHGTYSGNSNAVNGWKEGQTDTYAELEQITCQACSGCTTSSTSMSHALSRKLLSPDLGPMPPAVVLHIAAIML